MPCSFNSAGVGVLASFASVVIPAPSSARRAGAESPSMNEAAGLRAASHAGQVGQSELFQ
jgi:hypothetical protein